MSGGHARSKLKRAECSIVVFRADGTVEDKGIVCVNEYPSRFKRLWNKIARRKHG